MSAITSLDTAETQFYRDRRDLVNSYPLKISDITRAEIEALYDTHLGIEPWRYQNRFNSSGSRAKTGTYNNTTTYGGTHEEFYVEEYGTTPTGGYPTQINAIAAAPFSRPGSFLFDEERGASWVDLIVKHGFNRGFTSRGNSRRQGITVGAGSGSTTTYVDVFEGFGQEPIAYEGRGGLSDFEAHMLKLVGDAWEATVGSAYQEYRDALDAYRTSVGSPVGLSFTPSAGSGQWAGFTGTAGGYNRPQELSPALVNETRGVN